MLVGNYRRRISEIKAVQLNRANINDVSVYLGDSFKGFIEDDSGKIQLKVETNHGVALAEYGDYIIQTENDRKGLD